MQKNVNSFTWALSKTNLPYLWTKINAIDRLEDYEIHFLPRKDKRTLEQNARLWMLYTSIGNFLGDSPTNIHELMGFKFLRTQIVVNKETIDSIKSTTKLNTVDMADYQMKIEAWAATTLGWSLQ